MRLVRETSTWRSDVDNRLFSLRLIVPNVRERHIQNIHIFLPALFILHYLNKTQYIYEVYVDSFGGACVILGKVVKYLEPSVSAANICLRSTHVGCSAHSECSNRLAGVLTILPAKFNDQLKWK